MKKIRAALFGLLLSIAGLTPAIAQTSPNWTYGFVPTTAQWNALWASKQDTLAAPPLLTTGGTMTGPLITSASSTGRAGLNIPPGTAPTSPANGDTWTTGTGLFVRIAGSTVGPLTSAATPCTVCAVTNAANTFTASPQLVQGLTTTSPGWYAQITGDSVPRVRVGLNATDVASIAFGPGSGNRDTFIERSDIASVRFGAPDAAAPVSQFLGMQNVVAGTSDTAGQPFVLRGSLGTGTGAGGGIFFQVAPAGGSGSAQIAAFNALTIHGDGGVTLNGATSNGPGTINSTIFLNAATFFDITNTSTGTGALSSFIAQNSVAGSSSAFGLGGSGYTGQGGFLANKAFVFSNTNSAGIAIYATGTVPIDFYVNTSRVGGFTSAGLLTLTNNQNAITNASITNTTAGTAATATYNFNADTGGGAVGVTSSTYTGITALQNRAYFYSNSSANGIALYADGAKNIVFYTNSGAFAGVVGSDQRWTLGTSGASTSTANLTVTKNTAAAPSITSATGTVPLITAIQVDSGHDAAINMMAFGTGAGGTFNAFGAGGTAASPTATPSGQNTGAMFAYGYNTTSAGYVAGAGFVMKATELWTTNSGMSLQLFSTPTGTTGIVATATLNAGLIVGAPTGGDKGAGTINATGYFNNGVAVTGTGTMGTVTITPGTGMGSSGTCTSATTISCTLNNTGVTSVAAGYGISGGTITTTGTHAVSLSTVTNSLSGDVTLNNSSNYFAGPTVAQGATGTWYASGGVTFSDASASHMFCKLWDGTNVIDSRGGSSPPTVGATYASTIFLSGVSVNNPPGNIRIDCKSDNSTTIKMLFNYTGNSKDSSVTAVRIR